MHSAMVKYSYDWINVYISVSREVSYYSEEFKQNKKRDSKIDSLI
jgi:hypothetical protein